MKGMAMTIVEARVVIGGVDTHLDTHVAAALDNIGACWASSPSPPRRRAMSS